TRARDGTPFSVRTVRPFGLPEFLLFGRAAAELNLAATRLGMSLDTQQSTTDCWVPGESERHAGREVGTNRLAPKAPGRTREIRRTLDGLKKVYRPEP